MRWGVGCDATLCVSVRVVRVAPQLCCGNVVGECTGAACSVGVWSSSALPPAATAPARRPLPVAPCPCRPQTAPRRRLPGRPAWLGSQQWLLGRRPPRAAPPRAPCAGRCAPRWSARRLLHQKRRACSLARQGGACIGGVTSGVGMSCRHLRLSRHRHIEGASRAPMRCTRRTCKHECMRRRHTTCTCVPAAAVRRTRAAAGLPVLQAGGQQAVRGEEDEQAVRDHACKVDDRMAQVVAVPAGRALQACIAGACWCM